MTWSASAVRAAISEALEGSIGSVRTMPAGRFERGVFGGQPDQAAKALALQTTDARHRFDVQIGRLRNHASTPVSSLGPRRLGEVDITVRVVSNVATSVQKTKRETDLGDILADCEHAASVLARPHNLTTTDALEPTGIIGGCLLGPESTSVPSVQVVSEDWEKQLVTTEIVCRAIVDASTKSLGVDWSTVTLTAPLDGSIFYDVLWDDDLALFVAVGDSDPYVMTSTNGYDWEEQTLSGATTLRTVSYASSLDMLVTASFGGVILRSTDDGVSWTTSATYASTKWIGSAWSPTLAMFVLVADQGSDPLRTSTDGITWTVRTAPTTGWYDVHWVSELAIFVAVGLAGAVMTSADGITWTQRSAASAANWTDLTWSPELSRLVAVASSGAVMYSADGITWTLGSGGGTEPWVSVSWCAERRRFVAVSSGANTAMSMTSEDGITWTVGTATGDCEDLAWSPTLRRLVGVGNGIAFVSNG